MCISGGVSTEKEFPVNFVVNTEGARSGLKSKIAADRETSHSWN